MAHESHIFPMRSAATQMRGAEHLYRRLFEGVPLPLLVLTPDLRIANANDAYLAATVRSRDALAGLGMFEAFPDNPHDPEPSGVQNLRASLERVLASGKPDVMPLQRYDIRPENGPWEVRYWNPANCAVLDEGSVTALVHHVTDATAEILSARSGPGRPVRKPVMRSEDLLTHADRVIQDARMAVAEARRDLLTARERTRALCRLLNRAGP